MALSEARRKANHKWNAKNKNKSKVYTLRSNAKRFIKDFASMKDIEQLRSLLNERENKLKE